MEIEKFIEDYERALATQKWENLDPLICENATVTFSSGMVYKGKDQVKIAFERNFEAIKSEQYSIKNIDWLLKAESLGVYTFDFHWEGLIDNVLRKGAGRGTSVLIKENGYWKLLTEHLGPMPKNNT
ncbi:MAG: nuclear transport factor 2 family protein [Aureispira sp.]|nr:nuclear transport factor 2 family protein [Aureispira sp.]